MFFVRLTQRIVPEGVDQKFGWTSNVSAFRPAAGMKQIVTPNHFGLRIGKKGKGKPKL